MAKVEWRPKKSADAPYDIMYAPATLAHKPPQGNDAKCGHACHTIVKGKELRVLGLRATLKWMAHRVRAPSRHSPGTPQNQIERSGPPCSYRGFRRDVA